MKVGNKIGANLTNQNHLFIFAIEKRWAVINENEDENENYAAELRAVVR